MAMLALQKLNAPSRGSHRHAPPALRPGDISFEEVLLAAAGFEVLGRWHRHGAPSEISSVWGLPGVEEAALRTLIWADEPESLRREFLRVCWPGTPRRDGMTLSRAIASAAEREVDRFDPSADKRLRATRARIVALRTVIAPPLRKVRMALRDGGPVPSLRVSHAPALGFRVISGTAGTERRSAMDLERPAAAVFHGLCVAEAVELMHQSAGPGRGKAFEGATRSSLEAARFHADAAVRRVAPDWINVFHEGRPPEGAEGA